MSARYACRFIADKRSVSLAEVAADENERTVRVATGSGPGWEIVLPIWYLPSIAILGDTVAVWAGTRLYFLADGRQAICADFDDEVHAVYAIGDKFCVVAELSVFMYDADRSAVADHFQADEVLGASWWEGGKLFVESASGSLHKFSPSGAALHAEPTR